MKNFMKAINTNGRLALTVDRIVKMHEAGISVNTIAQQLTDNSRNKNVYSVQIITGIIALHEDCQSHVGITKAQASALISDQANYGTVLA